MNGRAIVTGASEGIGRALAQAVKWRLIARNPCVQARSNGSVVLARWPPH